MAVDDVDAAGGGAGVEAHTAEVVDAFLEGFGGYFLDGGVKAFGFDAEGDVVGATFGDVVGVGSGFGLPGVFVDHANHGLDMVEVSGDFDVGGERHHFVEVGVDAGVFHDVAFAGQAVKEADAGPVDEHGGVVITEVLEDFAGTAEAVSNHAEGEFRAGARGDFVGQQGVESGLLGPFHVNVAQGVSGDNALDEGVAIGVDGAFGMTFDASGDGGQLVVAIIGSDFHGDVVGHTFVDVLSVGAVESAPCVLVDDAQASMSAGEVSGEFDGVRDLHHFVIVGQDVGAGKAATILGNLSELAAIVKVSVNHGVVITQVLVIGRG